MAGTSRLNTRGYSVRRTTTADFAPGERAEFWTEHVRTNHCLLDYRFAGDDSHGDFHGGTVRQRGDRYQLVEFWSDPIAYIRSPRQIARDQDEDIRLLLPMRGQLAVRLNDDRETLLKRGEAGLLSMTAPFKLGHPNSARALILTLPKAEVPVRAQSRIDLSDGLGAILGTLVTGLARQRDRLSGNEFAAVCSHTAELLAHVAVPEPDLAGPGSLSLVERSFREYVAARSDDPDLTGHTAAAALGWSLRQIQVALQRGGTTPREVIRDVRLGRAHARLNNPALRHLGVTEIAFTSGFTSVSTFGEAFRRRYGATPRDIRNGGEHA